MAAIVQTPALWGSSAVELGGDGSTWRKKVLPVGTVDYKGQQLSFDRAYLQKLAASFNARAYDQVPFQIADARNTHTNDPERYRGEVTGMSADDSGLWVTVRTTPEGGALLSANPRLGVSARIVEEYARSDGQFFPAAIQHVLGTLDPRIPALGAWESVDLSNGYAGDAEFVIDLSTSDWDGEPAYDPYDFAGDDTGGGDGPVDDEHAALAGSMRRLAAKLGPRHPELGAAQHVADAADTVERGQHDGAIRHLNAAIGNLTPTSLRRHGLTDDEQHNAAKRSMDEIERHVLLVKGLRDGQGQGDGAELANDGSPDGLNPRGSAIYRKLCAKGVAPKVALAMARRAQARTAGKQFASDYDGYGGYDGYADPGAMIELAYAQAAARDTEDAARPTRRTSGAVSEDRLAFALGRVSRGTYTATHGQRALGFATGDGLPAAGPSPAGGCGCGAVAADGTTVSRHHEAGCGMALSGDEQAEAYVHSRRYAAVAQAPLEDANGHAWHDSVTGQAMTAADHLEALTGQRVIRSGDSPFEGGGRREMATAQRVTRFGDYDGDDPGQELTDASQRTLAWMRAGLGLPDQAADRQERQDRALDRLVQRPATRYRTYGEQLEQGESTAERAERYRQPVTSGTATALGWDDGCRLPGELTSLTYG